MDTTVLTDRLDELQHRLPSVPAKTLELTRAGFRRANHTAATVSEHVGELLSDTGDTLTRAARSTVGQGSSAARRAVSYADERRSEAVGQFRAQARRSTSAIGDDLDELVDDTATAIDPDRPLDGLTKSELYQMAQDESIDGRSSMSKRELVAALRSTGAT